MIQSHLRDCPPSLRMSKPHERSVTMLDPYVVAKRLISGGCDTFTSQAVLISDKRATLMSATESFWTCHVHVMTRLKSGERATIMSRKDMNLAKSRRSCHEGTCF